MRMGTDDGNTVALKSEEHPHDVATSIFSF